MFGKKSVAPQTKIDSLIGAGTRVDGSISFTGGLRIDGTVHGDVIGASGQESTLVVSEQATVEGEIRVGHVVVNGAVKGPIYASETLELQPRCRVTGDVHYNSLEMHLGAIVDGHLMHGGDYQERPVELRVAARGNGS